jgi:hypothetical protein
MCWILKDWFFLSNDSGFDIYELENSLRQSSRRILYMGFDRAGNLPIQMGDCGSFCGQMISNMCHLV